MNLILEIYQNILYFLELTFSAELLWIIFPLAVATIIMVIYFEKYKTERPGWNTYVSNSLVLLFVSVILFRYIYSIDGIGIINFVTHLSKTIVSGMILFMGIIILFLNFGHFLPEKIARHITSPLTLNLIAFVTILFVYSKTTVSGISIFFSLFLLFILLIIILNLMRIPIRNLFNYIKRMKEREKREEIIEDRKPIEDKKKEVKKEEKLVRAKKREVKKEEKKVKKEKLKKLNKQKKEIVKLKEVVRKPLKEVKK
jgi:ABC-type multidrug transport system fused ATPase/permease subunit